MEMPTTNRAAARDLAVTRRERYADWAAFGLRLVVGYGFLNHGLAKVTRGADAFADVVSAMGVPLPHVAAWATILIECIGGIAVLAGAFIGLASIPLTAVLVVAAARVHWRFGFSSIKLRAMTAAGPVALIFFGVMSRGAESG